MKEMIELMRDLDVNMNPFLVAHNKTRPAAEALSVGVYTNTKEPFEKKVMVIIPLERGEQALASCSLKAFKAVARSIALEDVD